MSRPQFVSRCACPVLLVLALAAPLPAGEEPAGTAGRVIPVAVVQFDAAPEKVQANLDTMERLARSAVKRGARWVVFHEAAACDYTDQLERLAEAVPTGPATLRMERLAKDLGCFLSFGLAEKDGDRFYITQVFVGPAGYFYRYRKTWLHKDPTDTGFRNEYARFDPGTGPELFTIDGVRATCFICADATSPRCLRRARALRPQVAFHPVNIVTRDGRAHRAAEAEIARTVAAPLVVPNRVGDSWVHKGGLGAAAIFSATGELLAGANSDGKEEVVVYRLAVPGDAGKNGADKGREALHLQDRRDVIQALDKASSKGLPGSEIKEEKLLPDRFNQLIAELIRAKKSVPQACEAIFLATLARFPSDAELRTAAKHVADTANREVALKDITWALLNSREFREHITTIQESWTRP